MDKPKSRVQALMQVVRKHRERKANKPPPPKEQAPKK